MKISAIKNMQVLKAENIYAKVGSINILNGTSFTVNKGESVGIIGPNGSGKTTLFNCISGFLPLSGGELFLNREPICNLPAYMRARKGLGRVFQNFGIFRDMTLIENIIVALEINASFSAKWLPFSVAHRTLRDNAMGYLVEVGLQDYAKSKAATLSGGQARLLEIARILAFGSEVLLFDEPTAGVSPKMKNVLVEIINRIVASGKTVLVIEHDIQFIEKFTSRVLVMESGKIVLDDTPLNVRSSAELQDIYFGNVVFSV